MGISNSEPPAEKKRTGFWSGGTLAERAKDLITPFCEERIDCNAYTLRMGGEFFTTSDHSGMRKEWHTKVRLKEKEAFLIPSGQFAFLVTEEAVEVPSDAMAFISVRSTYKLQGLINVSGFHVDPGYSDKLIFSVFNAGPSPVHLEQGLEMFLIWYADLDRDSQVTRVGKPGHGQISSGLVKNMDKVLSLKSISDEIESVKKKMAIQTALFTWAVGMASAIFIGAILALNTDLWTNGDSKTEITASIQSDQPTTEARQGDNAKKSSGSNPESGDEITKQSSDKP